MRSDASNPDDPHALDEDYVPSPSLSPAAPPRSEAYSPPSAPLYHRVPRKELADILAALDALQNGREHPAIFTVTGIPRSGKTRGLEQVEETARAQAIPVIRCNLDAFTDNSRNTAVNRLLEHLAGALDVDRTGWDAPTPLGRATLRDRARQVGDALAARGAGLLTFDNSDDNRDTRLLMQAVEDLLLTRLTEGPERNRSLVVVASRQELNWRATQSYVMSCPLHPFELEETQAALGCPAEAAAIIQQATTGLPGASAWLWEQGAVPTPADEGLAPELFSRVYDTFVKYLLGNDPALAALVQGLALIGEPGLFDVNDLQLLAQEISYLRGRFVGRGKAAFYNDIDRMYGLGLVRFAAKAGKFELEPHLVRLLDRWNDYNHPADYARNRDLAHAVATGALPAAPASPDVSTQGGAVVDSTATPGEQTTPVTTDIGTDGPPAMPAGATETDPDAPLRALCTLISNPPAEFRDRLFVGREHALDDLAGYACRQLPEVGDVVFLQGGAGSGKTALVEEFLRRARVAVQTAPASEATRLLVATRLKSADGQAESAPDSPYENPIPGLIDMEFSFGNRMSTVRREISAALVDALVLEEWRAENPTEEPFAGREITLPISEAALEEWRGRVRKEYFQEYLTAEERWDTDRINRAVQRSQPEAANAQPGASFQEDVDHAFLSACRRVARGAEPGPGAPRRRVILALDTFDYPVRSGLSATQFTGQVTARLAGDYFFLIACRPPIEFEDQNPYIQGDLANYLPDDLRDQARVMPLDELEKYQLTETEIGDFYKQRPWYDATEAIHYHYGTLDLGTSAKLADALARVVSQKGRLPVLLSLLEYYVGVVNVQHGESPAPGVVSLTNNPLVLLDLADDAFGDELIDGLLRDGATRRPTRQVALLLMGVVDRGISLHLLTGYPADALGPAVRGLCARLYADQRFRDLLDECAGEPGLRAGAAGQEPPAQMAATQIWAAVQELARPGSTLIKPVGNVTQRTAYKLHDYVSAQFERYINRRLAAAQIEADNPRFRVEPFDLLTLREQVIRAMIDYMYALASRYPPQETNAESTRIYQALRSALVYYGLRLAAIQYADEQAGRERLRSDAGAEEDGEPDLLPSDQTPPLPWTLDEFLQLPDSTPGKLEQFRSGALVAYLRMSATVAPPLPAATTTRLVFCYLLGKLIREVKHHQFYGFAEMLLQEVRYYLYEQRLGTLLLTNLTLPVGSGASDRRGAFAEARQLYRAAQLTWEQATGQYATASPWLERHQPGGTRLRTWRADSGWQTILALLQGDEPRNEGSRRYYQEHYAAWLWAAGYIRQAHDAWALLSLDADGLAYVDLLVKQANAAINNPADVLCHLGNRRLDPAIRGLAAAQHYLNQALALLSTGAIPPAGTATVHHTLGYLYRILDRLDWQVGDFNDPSTPPAYVEWGAVHHYHEAMMQLSAAAPTDSINEPPEGDIIEYTTALNGYSYILAMVGEVAAARQACDLGIELLSNLIQQPAADIRPSRAAHDALGRAYSTRGEIGWHLARLDMARHHAPAPDVQEFMTAIDNYDRSYAEFEDTNREWISKLDMEAAYVNFWLAFNACKRSEAGVLLQEWAAGREASQPYSGIWRGYDGSPEEAAAQLHAQVHFMRQTIYLLFLTDKPMAHRRLAQMLLQLDRMRYTVNMEPETRRLRAEELAFVTPITSRSRTGAPLPERHDPVLHAYINMQLGYRLALAIDDRLYKFLLCSETVELLAEYTDAATALAFYQGRLGELNLATARGTDHRESSMMSRSELAIGFAFLRQLESVSNKLLAAMQSAHPQRRTARGKADKYQPSARTPAETALLEEKRRLSRQAVSHLRKGFSDLSARSVADRVRMTRDINNLREDLQWLEPEDLGDLYGVLQTRQLGPEWEQLIEQMAKLLIKQHTEPWAR